VLEPRMANPAMVLGAQPGWPTGRIPVTDEVWDAAAAHYDEKGLAAIVLMIAVTNLFNRLNATTRQVAGACG
jgi:alkylhydroperoxidase family enzyme